MDELDATNNILILVLLCMQTIIEREYITTIPSIFPPEYSVMMTMHRIANSEIRIILKSSEAAWSEPSEDELCGGAGDAAQAGRYHRCEGERASLIIIFADRFITCN